jgi:hypothetical protein
MMGLDVMNDSSAGQSEQARKSLATWLVSPGTVVALALALGCFLVLLFVKSDWAAMFAGWWFAGVYLHRMVVDDTESELADWMGAPAFTLVLIAAFVIAGVFMPQVLLVVGALMIAALALYILLNFVRDSL